MLTEGMTAAAAGFGVGYESPSQLSRDYARVEGMPPRQDAERLKRALDVGAPPSMFRDRLTSDPAAGADISNSDIRRTALALSQAAFPSLCDDGAGFRRRLYCRGEQPITRLKAVLKALSDS